MDKKAVTAITLIAAMIAIALPNLMAVYLSNRQALDAESTLARSYASDVSHRNEIIGDQIASGINKLINAHAKDSCSDDDIERMRQTSINSSRVRAFGSRLTFYSGGVVEAQDKQGRLFGFGCARKVSTHPAAVIVDTAKAFGQEDDIPVITIERVVPVAACEVAPAQVDFA
jgi:sensor c-di-GMP phosphodiesterase-like protein